MGKYAKFRTRLLTGSADHSIDFSMLCQLLGRLGFDERCRGSHHIFTRVGVEEIINLQPKGKLAKAYQVKQVRNLILRYELGDTDVD